MGKKAISQAPSSTLHFDGWTRYFRHRHSINLLKNKMDSKFIKFHQYYLEISHPLKLILNFYQDLTNPFEYRKNS